MPTTVFLLGATGYIGGTLLFALKKAHPELDIKALVRSISDFDAIRAAGATPIQGSFKESEKVAQLSSEVDVVINTADSDDVELKDAILRGAKNRKESGRGITVFIHTSGSGVFIDGGKTGEFDPNGKVWNDNREEDIKAITTSMIHGQVDAPLLKAGEDGSVYTYIICPSIVYGPSAGVGLGRKGSVAFRQIIVPTLQTKHMFYIGEGSNVIPTVHIDDVISLYLLIFDRAMAGPPTSSPYARYFIAATDTLDMKSTTPAIAAQLHKRGYIDTPNATQITLEAAGPLGSEFAGNMLVQADRSRALGWVPKGKSMKDSLADDVDAVLAGL